MHTAASFDYYRERGVCYPDACSAEEILILQSNVIDVKTIFGYSNEGKHGQKWTNKAASLTLRMQVETFGPVIERVYLPTLVSFCCFMGGLVILISVASIMMKRGNSNTFTKIFAYQNAWNKLLNMKRPSKAVKSIDGVRAISMMWVMIAHLYSQIAVLGDARESVDGLKNGEWSFITGGTPSVDSFFCLGGLLLAYLSTDTIVKTFNTVPAFCLNWMFFMGNRWMRITPMVMAVGWTIVSVMPLVSDGWNYGLGQGSQRTCETNLWYSFFYLDGWVHGVEGVSGFFCNGVTWYLSCDFFYFALFPFIAVAYGWRKFVGIGLVLFCISGSMAHNMYSSFVSESYILQTYRIMTQWPQDRELDPYMPPWARYHSHGVGVLFGWLLLAERKEQIISKFLRRRRPLLRYTLVLMTWAITLGTFWFIVFGLNYCFKVNWTEEGKYVAPIDFSKYPGTGSQYIESLEGCMTKDGKMDWTAVSIWNGSFRAMWSIALSVMVILCDMRFGLLINWFLSSKPLLLVSKLSFGMYLLHYNIYAVFFPSIKHVILSDGYELFWAFTGLFTVTAIISLAFHLVIEAPFAAIWTIVLKFIKPPPKTKKAATVESELPKVTVDEKRESIEEKL